MNADGSEERRLTDTTRDDQRPSWSADGKRIVFGREGALFSVPAVGGPAQRVGKGLGNAANPAYSPDGKLIAYDYRTRGNGIREVYVMNADGTGIRRLTHLDDVSGVPSWSPDGRRIAFQSAASSVHTEIYSVGVDGQGLRQETTSTSDAIQPAWSPDGSMLTFSRDGAIWAIVEGAERRLTSGKDNDSGPAWRPVAEGKG
jgi:TolB protein